MNVSIVLTQQQSAVRVAWIISIREALGTQESRIIRPQIFAEASGVRNLLPHIRKEGVLPYKDALQPHHHYGFAASHVGDRRYIYYILSQNRFD